jgi:hypothetical protein
MTKVWGWGLLSTYAPSLWAGVYLSGFGGRAAGNLKRRPLSDAKGDKVARILVSDRKNP